MSTTTEKEISVADGLGDATPNQVMEGATFTSNGGVQQTGTMKAGDGATAGVIPYDNSSSTLEGKYVQNAIDELDSKVENKSEKGHNHDDKYYTEKEIDSKVQTLQNSIKTNSDNITTLQQNVTNQNNAFQNSILKNAEDISNNAEDISDLQESKENVSITKTTETTMPNSYEGNLLINEIGGVCEQETTTGAQLFDVNSLTTYGINDDKPTVTVDGNKVTVKGKGAYAQAAYIVKNSSSLAGKHVALSLSEVTNTNTNVPTAVQLMVVHEDNTRAYHSVGNINLLLLEVPYNVKELQIRIVCNNSNTVLETENTLTVEGVMFNIGDDALPWEPYTGGLPAPNPDFPREIKKSVVSEIRTHGKNLFAFGKTAIDRTTELRPNASQRLQISLVDANDLNKIKCGFRNGSWTSGYVTIYGIDGTKDYAISYDIEENTTPYIPKVQKYNSQCDSTKLTLVISSSNESNVVAATEYFILSNIQVEPGTATTYEPYTESTITLSKPIELYRIGDVQDVIEDGKVRRKLKKVVFDGSDDEGWANSAITGRYYVFLDDILASANNDFLCTQAQKIVNSSDRTYNKAFVTNNKQFAINTSFATLDEWKSHLQAHPMSVVYELAEEAIEELPLADQIALNSLQTFDSVTYLEFVSEIQPTFAGEYGTSRVGGCSLEALLESEKNEMKLEEMESKKSEGIATTTETTIQGSYAGNLLVEEIGGKCVQATTTGKQLLNLLSSEGGTSPSCDITATPNGDGTFTLNGTNNSGSSINNGVTLLGEKGGTVPLMYLNAGNYYASDVELYSYGEATAARYAGAFTLSAPTPITAVTTPNFNSGDTFNNKVIYPMLHTGVNPIPWEPYTGGVASPNPNYPQEIKYPVISEILTYGEQLFDGLLEQGTYDGELNKKDSEYRIRNTNNIAVNPNETYTISCSVAKDVALYELDASGKKSAVLSSFKSLPLTFTTSSNGHYIAFVLRISDTTAITPSKVNDVMLNKGTEAKAYEPYTGSLTTLQYPYELFGIGDIQDVMTNKVIKERFAKKVFDGSADENWVASELLAGRYYIDGISNSVKIGTAICTHSIHSNSVTEIVNHSYFSESVDGRFIINTSFATLDEWKEHLKTHPMTVIYELAEEVENELTYDYQVGINTLQTYDGVTYIEFDSEIQPTFKGMYAINNTGVKALQAYCNDFANQSALEKMFYGSVNIFFEHGLMFHYYKIGCMAVLQANGTLDYPITESNKIKTFSSIIPAGYRPIALTHSGSMYITSMNGNKITVLYDIAISTSGVIQVQIELKDAEGKSVTHESSGMPFNLSASYICM